MAWRPSDYLLDGELDNTAPGKVTGWMRFAGVTEKVTFDLEGNFHRDIRGAKIRLRGDGCEDDPKAAKYMDGFAEHQTGKVGDITAGLPPRDYCAYPYLEWFGDENGRVVLELEAERIEVIGTPIPACESDPISREEQNRNMAEFLASMSRETGAPAKVIGVGQIVSDPAFTHWVVEDGRVVGEARSVESAGEGLCYAFVRLFGMPEMAEHGSVEVSKLRPKNEQGVNRAES